MASPSVIPEEKKLDVSDVKAETEKLLTELIFKMKSQKWDIEISIPKNLETTEFIDAAIKFSYEIYGIHPWYDGDDPLCWGEGLLSTCIRNYNCTYFTQGSNRDLKQWNEILVTWGKIIYAIINQASPEALGHSLNLSSINASESFKKHINQLMAIARYLRYWSDGPIIMQKLLNKPPRKDVSRALNFVNDLTPGVGGFYSAFGEIARRWDQKTIMTAIDVASFWTIINQYEYIIKGLSSNGKISVPENNAIQARLKSIHDFFSDPAAGLQHDSRAFFTQLDLRLSEKKVTNVADAEGWLKFINKALSSTTNQEHQDQLHARAMYIYYSLFQSHEENDYWQNYQDAARELHQIKNTEKLGLIYSHIAGDLFSASSATKLQGFKNHLRVARTDDSKLSPEEKTLVRLSQQTILDCAPSLDQKLQKKTMEFSSLEPVAFCEMAHRIGIDYLKSYGQRNPSTFENIASFFGSNSLEKSQKIVNDLIHELESAKGNHAQYTALIQQTINQKKEDLDSEALGILTELVDDDQAAKAPPLDSSGVEFRVITAPPTQDKTLAAATHASEVSATSSASQAAPLLPSATIAQP